jgi:methionine-rich copper-binding protein CopC
MKLKFLAAALASTAMVAVAAPSAFAHAEITKSNIADHAKLTKAPDAYTASFEESAVVSGVALTGVDGKTIDLASKPSKTMSKDFSLPLPKLAAGAYTLTFKVVAKDGHAMTNTIHFTVAGG